ncbi:hypothetical protein Pelo_19317 [Pelomyxa schiedti]|nr:hypothetical protein Pelo_19317 [Pelomyxa schiedti]
MSFLGTPVQSVLEIKNALLSCRADIFAFQSSCAIPGALKRCENAFENSADSSSVRNSPKRECLMLVLQQIAMAARNAWRSQLSNRLP